MSFSAVDALSSSRKDGGSNHVILLAHGTLDGPPLHRRHGLQDLGRDVPMAVGDILHERFGLISAQIRHDGHDSLGVDDSYYYWIPLNTHQTKQVGTGAVDIEH